MIVTETNPPRVPSGGIYWERSLDPSHPDAFKNLPKKSLFVLIGNIQITFDKKRKAGWMLIDYSENAVAFAADGTVCEDHNEKFVFRMGPCKNICAYPWDEIERMNTHAKWISKA